MAARSAGRPSSSAASPGQAHHVLDRLHREKRVPLTEMERYRSELAGENARLHARKKAECRALKDARGDDAAIDAVREHVGK